MNFQMPTSTITDLGGQITNNMSSFSPIVIFICGLLVAFLVIEFIIDTITIKKQKNEK